MRRTDLHMRLADLIDLEWLLRDGEPAAGDPRSLRALLAERHVPEPEARRRLDRDRDRLPIEGHEEARQDGGEGHAHHGREQHEQRPLPFADNDCFVGHLS